MESFLKKKSQLILLSEEPKGKVSSFHEPKGKVYCEDKYLFDKAARLNLMINLKTGAGCGHLLPKEKWGDVLEQQVVLHKLVKLTLATETEFSNSIWLQVPHLQKQMKKTAALLLACLNPK